MCHGVGQEIAASAPPLPLLRLPQPLSLWERKGSGSHAEEPRMLKAKPLWEPDGLGHL